ncbi:MAG TPA: N-acetylglucosamine-6-phosphate deacetylase, partial [Micropepsaceae bacterium]|nr:N-acetylglucosamine-6-phosphate deacetylase [Micropepsaceae bacterium]
MTVRKFAVTARTLFDGESLRRDRTVIVEDGRIAAVVPRHECPAGLAVEELPEDQWLAPGFIDVQVNGGGDVLFNDNPTPEGIKAIIAAHRRYGTTALLPTLITDQDSTMRHARDAIEQAMRSEPGVLGVHFEGPFISPDKPGVHDPDMIRPPDFFHRDLVTGLPSAVTVVTLAPEVLPDGFMQALKAAGVRMALGHSNATYEETKNALAGGVTGFTHLFNAMRPMSAREPGPAGAALETFGCWYGLIVDGFHVSPAMLRLALRGTGSAMLVTDAMPCVGGKHADFMLHGRKIETRDGRCTTADGTLAGSAIDMATAVRNC